jgi:predicted transcriptional regulator
MSKNNFDGRLEAVLKASLAGYAEIMASEQKLLQQKHRIYADITNACIAQRNALEGNFELSIGLESAVHKLTEDLIASTKNLKRSFDILHGTFGRYLVAGSEVAVHKAAEPEEEEAETYGEPAEESAEAIDGPARKAPKKARGTAKAVVVTEESIADALLKEMGKGARKNVAQNLATAIAYLIENGPSSGEKLQEASGNVSQQTFGANMRRLREMGWIVSEGKARGMKYRVSEEGLKKVASLGE